LLVAIHAIILLNSCCYTSLNFRHSFSNAACIVNVSMSHYKVLIVSGILKFVKFNSTIKTTSFPGSLGKTLVSAGHVPRPKLIARGGVVKVSNYKQLKT
jgi:hypothetical protein